MRKGFRKAGVAAGTAFASVALALSTAAAGTSSPSGLVVGGLATPSMHDLVMAQVLKDELHGMERVSIWWPAEAKPYSGSTYTLGESINIGITNLNAAIDTAVGKLERDAEGNLLPKEQVKIVGLSAGSLVVTEVLRQLAADPDAPAADELTFIVVADSSRQKLINKARYNSRYDYTYQPAPDSQYEVKVVTGEYDGLADFPDRWWNFLAVANAIAGSIFVHVPMMFADLKDEYITGVEYNDVGGKVTNYLIPTAKLPLVQLLPFLAPREAELKAKIDKAYSRNDIVDTSAARSLVSASPVAEEEAVVSAPADEAEDVTEVADPVQPVGYTEDTGGAQDAAADDTTGVEDDVEELDAVDGDADAGTSTDDADAGEAEAEGDAETADSADAAKDDDEAGESEDSSGSSDSSDSGDSDSSAESSSGDSGSSDSGSSE